jgi:hypothetical protein
MRFSSGTGDQILMTCRFNGSPDASLWEERAAQSPIFYQATLTSRLVGYCQTTFTLIIDSGSRKVLLRIPSIQTHLKDSSMTRYHFIIIKEQIP